MDVKKGSWSDSDSSVTMGPSSDASVPVVTPSSPQPSKMDEFLDWFTGDRTYLLILGAVALLGLCMMIAGAVDVANTADEFGERLDTNAEIVNVEINQETNCGALVVQYTIDNIKYRIYDDVTPPMLCGERENWLSTARQKFLHADKPAVTWPVVRYNRTNRNDATLVEKDYDATGVGFLVTGIILLLIAIPLFVAQVVWKVSPTTAMRGLMARWTKSHKNTSTEGEH